MPAPLFRSSLALLLIATLAHGLLAFPLPLPGRGRTAPPAAASPEPPPPVNLRAEMSAADFAAAGLHKLDDAERAALEAWINTRQSRTTEEATERYIARGETGFGLEDVPARVRVPVDTPEEIRSVIPGPFTGWSGNTTLRLANGQVWQTQRAPAFSVRVTGPEVVIRRGAFGTYQVRIQGYGTTAQVKRIE